MSVRILALALVGCGRIGFDITSHAADGATDAPACTSFGPWNTPVALGPLNTPKTEFGAQITRDGLTLYFDANTLANDQDLFAASRPDRSSPFGVPVELAAITTTMDDDDATISDDGLELIFHRGNPSNCIYDARRASTSDAFTSATTTTICGASGAYLSRDGLTLYYNTRVDGFGEGVLYTTTRASTADPFTPGTPIAELSGGATKGYPALTFDELAIVFESTGGGPDLDLFIATRATTTDPWSTPARIPELETAGNEGDASFTADGTEIFFASDVSGSYDLYHATRSCL
jgi:hypothetical protein